MRLTTWMAVSSIVLARSAGAAEPSTAGSHDGSPPPSSIVADQPASPSASGRRVHDGAYLRMAAGGGLVGVDLDPEFGYEEHSADGAGVAFELLIGASPARGGVVGGALLLDVMPSMRIAPSAQKETDAPVGIGLLGPFVDVFPEPEWGWHFGGTFGLAGVSLQPIDSRRHRLVGLGGAVWGGHDFWVADEWSLGGVFRIMRTVTAGDAGDYTLEASTLSASLLLTGVHH